MKSCSSLFGGARWSSRAPSTGSEGRGCVVGRTRRRRCRASSMRPIPCGGTIVPARARSRAACRGSRRAATFVHTLSPAWRDARAPRPARVPVPPSCASGIPATGDPERAYPRGRSCCGARALAAPRRGGGRLRTTPSTQWSGPLARGGSCIPSLLCRAQCGGSAHSLRHERACRCKVPPRRGFDIAGCQSWAVPYEHELSSCMG